MNGSLLIATFSPKHESELASIEGMNAFASSVILCQKPLQEFLDSTPDVRLEEFGPLVGMYRMVRVVHSAIENA